MSTNAKKLVPDTAEHWSAGIGSPWIHEAQGTIIFKHFGVMDPMMISLLIAKAENASVNVADGVVMRKRLVNVLVEGLENMYRHTPEAERSSGFALLMDRADGYRILLGNAVPVASAALLVHRVEMLNEMEEADLKEHFLKLLAHDGRTERGGAGLGLITMSRKSARPMRTHSIPKDEHTAYFALELAVLRS